LGAAQRENVLKPNNAFGGNLEEVRKLH
jgi:hypothetical protein